MRRFSERYQHGILKDLNVTPLLDLAFVLLIIFMITAPFLAATADFDLPSSTQPTTSTLPEHIITINIPADGLPRLDDQPIVHSVLTLQLTQQKTTQPDLAVLLQVDKNLDVQSLVNTMDAIKKADIRRVGLITTSEE